MKNQKLLAVFPLPIFLLPEGRTRLRIFEPRYIRMVKESAAAGGFVVSLLQKENEFLSSEWGTWVEIIDFETLSDGMLGITVEAKHLVQLSDFFRQEDDLLNASIHLISHWSKPSDIGHELPSFVEIQQTYSELLSEQTMLAQLYPEPKYNDLPWLVARWLEILPLNPQVRKKLTQKDSFALALKTVETIILGK